MRWLNHSLALALLLAACSTSETPSSGDSETSDSGAKGAGKHSSEESPSESDASTASSADTGTVADASDAWELTSVQLNIPPREQWPNDGGYCGETSLQSIALHFGAWISQEIVRKAAGGEMLLGVNDSKALDALHFTYTRWDSESAKPQFESFAVWTKKNLAARAPVIFTVYLTDGTNDPDYDHIMVATGANYRSSDGYDATDRLFFNNNFGSALSLEFGAFHGTRKTCTRDSAAGGCIPESVDYGVAITGIVDPQKATRPVDVTVANQSEPNVSKGDSPVQMTASVKASGLTKGGAYALLRYDGYKKVPVSGSAAEILAEPNAARVDFVATSTEWTYADPTPFSSDEAVYYRCVQR